MNMVRIQIRSRRATGLVLAFPEHAALGNRYDLEVLAPLVISCGKMPRRPTKPPRSKGGRKSILNWIPLVAQRKRNKNSRRQIFPVRSLCLEIQMAFFEKLTIKYKNVTCDLRRGGTWQHVQYEPHLAERRCHFTTNRGRTPSN